MSDAYGKDEEDEVERPRFERGSFEDWEIECIDSAHYAIYRKGYNEEWQDANGDNLHFDTKAEAEEYLRKEFEK